MVAEARLPLRVLSDDDYATAAAKTVAAELSSAVDERGVCRFGLAGGTTPRAVYERLAEADALRWEDIELFWSDERAVPPNDDRSNYKMSAESLGMALGRARRVNRIRGELSAPAAAAEYAAALGDAPLDVLLLGMGEDGHTASLFPPSDGEKRLGDRAVATRSPLPPADRISLSLRAINESRSILFLVRGAVKAPRLAQVQKEHGQPSATLPAAQVRPTRGRLLWLIDRDLASALRDHNASGEKTDG